MTDSWRPGESTQPLFDTFDFDGLDFTDAAQHYIFPTDITFLNFDATLQNDFNIAQTTGSQPIQLKVSQEQDDPAQDSEGSSQQVDGRAVKRRAHRKSRTGCRTCKRRRVKCDEVHPQCGNCAHLALPCSFQPPISIHEKVSTMARSSLGLDELVTSATLHTQAERPAGTAFQFGSTITGNNNGIVGAAAAGFKLTVEDLKLMHIYTLYVNSSISIMHETGVNIWKEKVPDLAFKNQHLLCAVLVFSATYLIRDKQDAPDPERSALVARRLELQVEGIRLLKVLLQQPVNKEIADSAFLALYIFMLDAIANLPTIYQAKVAGIPTTQTTVQFLTGSKWLNLIRGLCCVMRAVWPLQKGSLSYDFVYHEFYDLPLPRLKIDTKGLAKDLVPFSIRKHYILSASGFLTFKPGNISPWGNYNRPPSKEDRWLYDEDDMADLYPLPFTSPVLIPCWLLSKFKMLIVAGRNRVMSLICVGLGLLDARFFEAFHANDIAAHRYVAEFYRAARQFAKCNRDDVWWFRNLAESLDVVIPTEITDPRSSSSTSSAT
ncbi:hypothetical protein V1512DRAFT_266484 [Lipomyces arxii]|uniref:uncharacterized protein n=1 Tax=Lipomyces arxii TaxID=56418 RepID=UPI0034CE6C63